MSCKNDYPKDIKLVRTIKLPSEEWNKVYQHGANLLNKEYSSLFYSKLWETVENCCPIAFKWTKLKKLGSRKRWYNLNI